MHSFIIIDTCGNMITIILSAFFLSYILLNCFYLSFSLLLWWSFPLPVFFFFFSFRNCPYCFHSFSHYSSCFTTLFWNNCIFTESCKTSTKDSCVPFTQLPQMSEFYHISVIFFLYTDALFFLIHLKIRTQASYSGKMSFVWGLFMFYHN